MREKVVELVRFTCVLNGKEEFFNKVDIPINRITKRGKVSLSSKMLVSKKTYDQGIELSDILSFSFRESQGSSRQKRIFELYCFKDQEYIGYKIFNRRLEKVISKEEKKNENQERSN